MTVQYTGSRSWRELGLQRTPDHIRVSETAVRPMLIRSKHYPYVFRYSTESAWFFRFTLDCQIIRRGWFASEYDAACGYDDYLDTLGIDEDERPRLVVEREDVSA